MDININYHQWLEKPDVEKLLEEKLTESIITKLYLTTPGGEKETFILFPTLIYITREGGGDVKLIKTGKWNSAYFKLMISFYLDGKPNEDEEEERSSTKNLVYFGELTLEQDLGVDIQPLEVMYLKAEELGPNALSFISPFITEEGIWKFKQQGKIETNY